MPEARITAWPAHVRPAVGGGGSLPTGVLLRRGALALGLILFLGLAKYVVDSHSATLAGALSALHGRPVAVGLDIGGPPNDSELQTLATSHQVDGVVNLGSPNVAERATASSLSLAYLSVPVAAGKAPTWPELRALADFLRTRSSPHGSVYMHDDGNGGQAAAAADMLLLLRGQTWPAVSRSMTSAQLRMLSYDQLLAIRQLITALDPGARSTAGDPYSSARPTPWGS